MLEVSKKCFCIEIAILHGKECLLSMILIGGNRFWPGVCDGSWSGTSLVIS